MGKKRGKIKDIMLTLDLRDKAENQKYGNSCWRGRYNYGNESDWIQNLLEA